MITSFNLFETERLIVRQYTLQDEEYFYLFSSNEDVMRYIRPIVNREESARLLALNMQLYLSRPNTGRWAIFNKATGSYMGSFSILEMDIDKTRLHIGYALLPQFWGMGYATEVLQQGVAYFFASHNAPTLYAITEDENVASQKVLVKCGFTYQGSQREKSKNLMIFILQRS